MKFDTKDLEKNLRKWQDILRLKDWDIKYELVDVDWRKSGDVKIDAEDKKAVLLINDFNPKSTNLEELVIHELMHIKLWGMDQMIEELIYKVFGEDENDDKFDITYTHFMKLLEKTTEDLTKSFVELGAEDKELSFGRLKVQVDKELNRM